MRIGLHAPVQGATQRFIDAAGCLVSEAFVWLSSERPADAGSYPDALHIVRLDNWGAGESADAYASHCAGQINAWFAVPNVVFQLGNEPDLESNHLGDEFPIYAERFRAIWPGIRLANPPLKAENTHLWDEATICAGDYLSCHCYWQINHPEDIDNPNLGSAYGHLTGMGKPVIVTEINAVPASGIQSDTNVDWDARNSQVTDWCIEADLDGIHACCLFLGDASPQWAGFDIGPEAAAAIRAGFDSVLVPDEPDGGGTMSCTVDELLAMAVTQVGIPYSGDYDALNGNHPWSYWCEAYVESTHRNCGLSVTPQVSALTASQQYDLQQGRAPRGAAIFFGTSFYYPDGHTAISCGDGSCIGTLTDGTGVGFKYWNETTNGYLGWSFYEGVISEEIPAPDPPMENWFVQEGNPYQEYVEEEIGIGGGFLRYYNSLGLDPMVVLGFAKNREQQAIVTDDDGSARDRTVQVFQRGTLIYQPEVPFPGDVVMALTSSSITLVA